jgi:hypothetical protein
MKDQTSTHTFPSKYGGDWITPAQYLTEYLCEIIARQQKEELPDKFWQEVLWCKIYKTQIVLVNRLLKTYDVSVILQALKHPQCRRLQSFGAKWLLEPILKKLQKQFNAKTVSDSSIREKTPIDQAPRPATSNKKQSLFSQLK